MRERSSIRVGLGLAAWVVILAGCGAPADRDGGAAQRQATGRLVIVGGALDEDNAAVWRTVLEGRDGEGRICVIPTASGEPESSMRSAVETLDAWGGSGVAMGIRITEGDTAVANDPAMAATLLGCSGFWFTGGSQSRITATFMPGGTPTPVSEAIRLRFQEGAVVAGTSAGAAMMSTQMIAGGSSEEALRVGLRSNAEGEGVRVRPGLGFFDVGTLDQHFLARGRIGRLLVAVLDHPDVAVGFGIDENTALVVDGRSAEVVGQSGVVVVDGREGDPADAGRELAVWLVGTGDGIDLEGLDVTVHPDKRPLVAGDARLPEVGIFEQRAFLEALYAFSRRPDVGMMVEPVEGVLMTLEKGDGFTAVARPGSEDGVEGVPVGLSTGPFRVRIEGR